MKKICFPALFLLSSLYALSQQQNTTPGNETATWKTNPGNPLFVVSGEEIRRFPSDNFLDAVNGLFPGVFSQTPNTNEFLFIVNGFILPDINGLSLYDIEEVVFTRNNLHGSLYPYSRPGTFYISTKSGSTRKPVIEFNSQYNLSWNKRSRYYLSGIYGTPVPPTPFVNQGKNEAGHLLSNHLSLATGSDKFHLYSGLQWNKIQSPPIRQLSYAGSPNIDSMQAAVNDKRYNLKAFLNLEYRFSDKIQAGFTGNYFYGHSSMDMQGETRSYLGNARYNDTMTALSSLNNYQVGAFINWRPLAGLRNRIYIEHTDNDFDYKSSAHLSYKISASGPADIYTNSTTRGVTNVTTLRNQLEYDLPMKSKFKLGLATWFTYITGKFSIERQTIQINNDPGFPSINTGWSKYKQKTTSLNPQLNFSYDSILTGYAGYAFLLNKGISRFNSRSKSNPYAGAVVNLKKGFGIKQGLDQLELAVHYGDLGINQSANYWLPTMSESGQSFAGPGILISGVYTPILIPSADLSNVILKNRMLSLGLNAGFLQNRIRTGIDWTSVKAQRIFILEITTPNPEPAYFYVPGDETKTGISAYIAASVVKTAKNEWETRFHVLLPDTKQKIEGFSAEFTNPLTYSLQTGWQNRFRFSNIFVQVNALLGLDRNYYQNPYNFYPRQEKKINEFNLNYLLVGYDLPVVKSSFFETVSVFAQARNVLGSKDAKQFYQYDSYGGIGINLRFK